MIYANFIHDQNRIKQFTLSGHAESGPYGHDLVCAAASALTIGTTNNLKRLVSIEPKVDANEIEGGFLEVTLPAGLDVKQQEQAELLLQSLYYSLADIQESYGDFISVSNQKNA